MKKTILVGSILVLTLLLLMPSIPAIQQNAIEGKIYRNLVEKLDDDVKFPIILGIINSWLWQRYFRAYLLVILSYPPPYMEIKYPIIADRAERLWVNTEHFSFLFQNISDILGLGWDVLIYR